MEHSDNITMYMYNNLNCYNGNILKKKNFQLFSKKLLFYIWKSFEMAGTGIVKYIVVINVPGMSILTVLFLTGKTEWTFTRVYVYKSNLWK
jgi:hypothetical protein